MKAIHNPKTFIVRENVCWPCYYMNLGVTVTWEAQQSLRLEG